jgi:hypothetical protein
MRIMQLFRTARCAVTPLARARCAYALIVAEGERRARLVPLTGADDGGRE